MDLLIQFIASLFAILLLTYIINQSVKFSNMITSEQPLQNDVSCVTPISLGEHRVRVSFNPSNSSTVDQIKQKSAELINICDELKIRDGRLASLAQTAYEEAAMWAVKAATSQPAGTSPSGN